MVTTDLNQPTLPTLSAEDLPAGIRVFWDTAPEQFKIPAMLTSIVCYCALGTRLRAQYVYDDPSQPHALLLQLLVLGEPGSGKSFTRPIVKQLMRPLKLMDLQQKRIEQAYAELKKTASKNKQLPDEPITCCRNLQTITRAKLVKRADMFIRKYGEPLAFFFFNEELATMTESNRRAFADLNTMDRLAYDLGAEFGSDTLSEASYNADVDIIYCSLFCGTDNALSEYINKRAIEGGNCTRKVLTRIDEDGLGEDAPRFRTQTAEERKCVEETVNLLMRETYTPDDLLQPTHEIDMAWINQTVEEWCNEQRQCVIKNGNRAHNCFYKRSSVSAWRMACLCYHLWGEREEAREPVIRFYRFMASYILEGLLAQWGNLYNQLHQVNREDESKRVTLFDQMPAQFSRDQLNEQCLRMELAPGRTFLHKWKKAGLVCQPNPAEEIYVKTQAYGEE